MNLIYRHVRLQFRYKSVMSLTYTDLLCSFVEKQFQKVRNVQEFQSIYNISKIWHTIIKTHQDLQIDYRICRILFTYQSQN